MSEYIFGAHILESLTTGMYKDSRMIFREYIQNSCDSIDKAEKLGILEHDDGRIEIEIDHERRNITIRDNAMGIESKDFVRVMGSIGDSDKHIGEDRGFRGIGRLCGLAYCETLIFTSKFMGENVISRLECNAKILRNLLNERNSGVNRYTASEVLSFVNEFTQEQSEETEAHYFTVELINITDINNENNHLLNYENVRDYLSFTAPLPYHMTFIPFRSKIYEHADKLGFKIDEYYISLNDEQLFKQYTPRFSTRKGYDEIFDIEFENFRDINNNLLAWFWYGVSHFRGAIDERNLMRGIRLRKGNIQIGNEYTLREFFSEARGNSYFIGEIFCISADLIPNSQRDYFSENIVLAELEKQLRIYLRQLSKTYHEGSVISSSLAKYDAAEKKKAEISERLSSGSVSEYEKQKEIREELQKAEEEAESARAGLDKLKTSGTSVTKKIISHIETKSKSTAPFVFEFPVNPVNPAPVTRRRSQQEIRLLKKIFDVIKSTLDIETAEKLIIRIEAALK